MELQEAVRWTEMIRASRTGDIKKTGEGFWRKFFSKLTMYVAFTHLIATT